jgi:hypothetical protein
MVVEEGRAPSAGRALAEVHSLTSLLARFAINQLRKETGNGTVERVVVIQLNRHHHV